METGAGDLNDPKDRRVLIVDDDDSVLSLLEHVVRKEGFVVDTAADGETALKKIEAGSPSLIVLDLMLPRYGGFEILRGLQTGESAGVPIVVITGRYTDRSTSELIRQESNVADFFEKPLNMPRLLGALHRVLRTRPPESHGGPGLSSRGTDG